MTKVKLLYTIAIILALFSCSRTTLNMKNNNWNTRTYHNVTSKYNIYFNGNEAYEKGVAKIKEQNSDDYSRILPVFMDGQHENYSNAKAEMEYAIEKANKIIQLHSIKKKPKFNPKKAADPEYRAWRNQQEFNKMVDDAYLLIGKANFYQGEFLAAIGVFNHVALKYSGEEAWYKAHLWIARAYLEMGWLYEAENMLTLVNDENLPYFLVKDFNIISADLNIKRQAYKEAIPFLNSALETRLPKANKQRLSFILAQIHQQECNNALAYDYYKKVVRSIPSYEMEFNARIRMTEVLVDDDARQAIKKLNKMLKDPKNLDYKGQIYYALGNIYTKQKENMLAIENYRLSLELSEGLQKGITAKTIGELYYEKEDYLKASPYYATAIENLPDNYPSFFALNYRSDVLKRLSTLYEELGSTDRDYRISQMSESEKEAFLAKEKAEEELEGRIQELIADAQGENEKELEIQEEQNVKVGDWYFFNPNLVEQGKEEFNKQWGERQLRDNWRRSMANTFESNFDDIANEENTNFSQEQNQENDSDAQSTDGEVISEEDSLTGPTFSASEQGIIDAYFNLGSLYLFDIENVNKAIETFDALEAQYPLNKHSADSYFAVYTAATEENDIAKAEEAKSKILKHFPHSNYALILTNPEAKNILNADKKAYNDLYERTFNLFLKGRNPQVIANTARLKTEFRDTSLTPKILLMEALAIAKTEPEADIRPTLKLLIENYAYDEEVSAQASIILAQLGEGKQITLGGSAANTLSERRRAEEEIERQRLLETQQYVFDEEARHYLVLVLTDSLGINQNQLQYDIARFNFNKFLTMDFELSFGKLNKETNLMIINGFSNLEEGLWYRNQFLNSEILSKYPEIKKWHTISEENFRLLLLLKTLKEYETFENQH